MSSLLLSCKAPRKWVWNPNSKRENSSSPAAAFNSNSSITPSCRSVYDIKPKPSTTRKLHRRSRSSVTKTNDLEQLSLDVRAEKQLWKNAADRAERKKMAQNLNAGTSSVSENDLLQHSIGGLDRMKVSATVAEGLCLLEQVDVLPCLAEYDDAMDRYGDSGISYVVFEKPVEVATREVTPLGSSIRDNHPQVPIQGSPSAPRGACLDSIPGLKEHPSISTMVFTDQNAELDSPLHEELISSSPRPALRRVLHRIDFEECRARRSVVVVQADSSPLILSAPSEFITSPHADTHTGTTTTSTAPWHPPFCFESFGFMASCLLNTSHSDSRLERLEQPVARSTAHLTFSLPPSDLTRKPSPDCDCENERVEGAGTEEMEGQITNLTRQLNDAVAEIQELLAQLHQTQDEALVMKRETTARDLRGAELERELEGLRHFKDDVLLREHENVILRGELKALQALVSLHKGFTDIRPKDRSSFHQGSTCANASSPPPSFSYTGRISNDIGSMPSTPGDQHAPALVASTECNHDICITPDPIEPFTTLSKSASIHETSGTPALPFLAVHIDDLGYNSDEVDDELDRAYEDEDEDEDTADNDDSEQEQELGLEVNLEDLGQIPRLLDEPTPVEVYRLRFRRASREEVEEDENLLYLPIAKELHRHEIPLPRKLYSSWREAAAEQSYLRQMRIEP